MKATEREHFRVVSYKRYSYSDLIFAVAATFKSRQVQSRRGGIAAAVLLKLL